jgi:hypothetical protein
MCTNHNRHSLCVCMNELPCELVRLFHEPWDPLTVARMRLVCMWWHQCLKPPAMRVPRWWSETPFPWEWRLRKYRLLLVLLERMAAVGSPRRAPDAVWISNNGGLVRVTWRFLPWLEVVTRSPGVKWWGKKSFVVVLLFQRANPTKSTSWHVCDEASESLMHDCRHSAGEFGKGTFSMGGGNAKRMLSYLF